MIEYGGYMMRMEDFEKTLDPFYKTSLTMLENTVKMNKLFIRFYKNIIEGLLKNTLPKDVFENFWKPTEAILDMQLDFMDSFERFVDDLKGYSKKKMYYYGEEIKAKRKLYYKSKDVKAEKKEKKKS